MESGRGNEAGRLLPPQVLLGAYARGVFPMSERGEIMWFSPLRRGLIPLDDSFHVPHGLRRSLRKRPFELRWNTAFREVVEGCASRAETWIDGRILESYVLLHELGHAHSVECWDADGLQGGLYGVALGAAFFGESMFTRKTDASKVALVELVTTLRRSGYRLLDTQWITPHLARFGAYEVPRDQYLGMLERALERNETGRVVTRALRRVC